MDLTQVFSNINNLLTLGKAIEIAAVVSALAGISAAVLMKKITKHFGTGIIATGYRYIAGGVALIGLAMIIESAIEYLQIRTQLLILVKEILLVLGTYIIVVGTKITADKLDNLTGKTGKKG